MSGGGDRAVRRWRGRLVAGLVGLVGVMGLPSPAGGFSTEPPRPSVSPHGEASADLSGLLAAFGRMPGLYARFREEKYMTLLVEPLVNEGTLHFVGGRLARHTERPAPSSVVIADGRLRFGDAHHVQQLELGANPVVAMFVESFVRLLAGDEAGLRKIYAMQFSRPAGPEEVWRLTLRPTVDPMDKLITGIELEGHGLVLRRMQITETGGDRTTTTFADVDPQHRYTPEEIDRVFRIPPISRSDRDESRP